MKIGIMQPYFLPYLGYWQLINAVDKYVVYDNIQFEKRSWIRRNRILINGKDFLFSLPIKSDSDYLDIRERFLSETYFNKDKDKLLKIIASAYKKAPRFEEAFSIIQKCINHENNNLFEYIFHSIIQIMKYLGINTEIIISSDIDIDHFLRNKHRVIEICKALGGDIYINSSGGINLYDKKEFSKYGLELKFIKMNDIQYRQFDHPFVPNLSIIDTMMFNDREKIKEMLHEYQLL